MRNFSFFRGLAKLILAFLLLCEAFAPGAEAGDFVPEQPVMALSELRAGMKGYLLTVLKGTKPVRLPLEIVSLIPQDGGAKQSVVIRLLPSPEGRTVAQGMSGSPVFVGGKLVGAVGMGWDFSDHRMALVTPIEEMRGIFSHPDKPVKWGTMPLGSPIAAGGLSASSAG
ncbi:MAG: peptidase S55, partial [Synergistaceae bacterium]|nr:peptidase S55 [Synergistaceae bacterium]